jgi:hypothetical protein
VLDVGQGRCDEQGQISFVQDANKAIQGECSS